GRRRGVVVDAPARRGRGGVRPRRRDRRRRDRRRGAAGLDARPRSALPHADRPRRARTVTRVGRLAAKDLRTTWASPVPYVVGAGFHVALGLLYVNQLQVHEQAIVQPLFPLAGFLLVLTVPVLTMRALAEESRTGTLDLLVAI